MQQIAAIIVAAGSGTRAGVADGTAKQFLKIGGKSILARSIETFRRHPRITQILPVIQSGAEAAYRAAYPDHDTILSPAIGGQTRQESVRAGLHALRGHAPDIVLIHDAARPYLKAKTIDDVIDAIETGIGALPACAQSDTLKRADSNGFVVQTIPRAGLFCAQTPQGFVFREILAAHEGLAESGETEMTDDASVAEASGIRIRLVPSDSENAKITTPEDVVEAQRRLSPAFSDIRTGNGFDVHALQPGTGVTLCGIEIDSEVSLVGHSDADVALHAITDAILGALGIGDIGQHFPPGEDEWRGASSDHFLAHACHRLAESGGHLTHLDVTLICEIPKIGPHREAMRRRIAEIAGIEMQRVSVKATTSEGLGFTGRREGIAALATATVILETGGEAQIK